MSRSISYPYPVLGPGDDIGEGAFTGQLKASIGDAGAFVLRAEDLSVTNDRIAELIKSGSAAFSLQLSCPRTYLRQCWSTAEPTMEVTVPGAELIDFVDARVMVVAVRQIDGYQPSGLNSDYGGATFTISAGSILAYGPEATVFLEELYDPLKGSMGSLIKVQEGLFDEGPFMVEFDERIVVSFSKKDWQRYPLWKKAFPRVLHSAMVLPVLADGIARVRVNKDEDQDTTWFRMIRGILDEKGFSDEEDALVVAQRILDNPFSAATSQIEAVGASEEQ